MVSFHSRSSFLFPLPPCRCRTAPVFRSRSYVVADVFFFPSLGTANIYNNYIRAKLPPGSTTGAVPKDHRASGVAGALGMGQQKAFAIRTFNTFWVYTMPFVGAIIADCWWGRYKTIVVFSLVYLYVKLLHLPKIAPYQFPS